MIVLRPWQTDSHASCASLEDVPSTGPSSHGQKESVYQHCIIHLMPIMCKHYGHQMDIISDSSLDGISFIAEKWQEIYAFIWLCQVCWQFDWIGLGQGQPYSCVSWLHFVHFNRNFSKLKMKVLKTLSSIEWVTCEWQICTIPSVQLVSSLPPFLCVHLNGCSTVYGEAQLCWFVFYSSEICWEVHVMVLPRLSFRKIIPRWEPRLCTMARRENGMWAQPFSTHLQR